MKIIYKCTCMDAERQIEVMDRPEDGDLILWMNLVVGGSISCDHTARCPRCPSETMEYVKIPVDENADGIGMKRKMSS